MSDDDITGLAHELWAMAQDVAPISDRVDLMSAELQKWAAAERERWKNLLSLQQRSYEREIAIEVAAERERCAALMAVTRADVSLAVGEMTAGEWRTCSAVLQVLRNRMRQP
jgi:hypothetical protein